MKSSVLSIALLASCAATAGALDVKVHPRVLIDRVHYNGFFPTIHLLSSGELVVTTEMSPDAHNVEGNFWAYLVSKDKGKTWGMRHTGGMTYRGEAAFVRQPEPDGSLFFVGSYPLFLDASRKRLQYVSVRLAEGGREALYRQDVELSLPQASKVLTIDGTVKDFASLGPGKVKESGYLFFSGEIVKSPSGRWLGTLYGKFEGDRYYRTIVVESDASRKRWSCLATVAGDPQAVTLPGEKTTQGFCEPRMLRIRDGRLFIVMRRGSDNLMYRAWSGDEGRTWTAPESIGFKGVEPNLWQMTNGLLALTTGRPDPVSLYLSEDGGQTWSAPTVISEERSTKYTDVVEIAPGKLFVDRKSVV